MTMHQSAIDRMKREGMTQLAAEVITRAIDDREEEIAASRTDIAGERDRLDQDELYVAQLEKEVAALRARLQQLQEAAS